MYYGQRAWLGASLPRVLSKVRAGRCGVGLDVMHANTIYSWPDDLVVSPHVAGVLPFDVPSDAPPALAYLMRACLQLDPGLRPCFSSTLSQLQGIADSLPHPDSLLGAAAAPPSRSSSNGGWSAASLRSAGSGMAAPFASNSQHTPSTSLSPFASISQYPAATSLSPFASNNHYPATSPFANSAPLRVCQYS
jgi:hypothetical protein